MLIRHGRMLCFEDGTDRFQMRAAGIALREGHVLVHRATTEAFWSLPGGRVEQGEASGETLFREMQEELETDVAIGPLAFMLESFFPLLDRQFHEIGFYHRMTVPETFPFATDGICHRIMDGAAALEFKWVPATAARLAAEAFRPAVLQAHLGEPQPGVLHFVERETLP